LDAHSAARVRLSRIVTAACGLTGTVLAMNVSRIGTLLEIANKLINAFSGPLFGIYLLAMFSRRATGTSALAGGLVGSLVSYVVAYHTPIGFLWPSTFGLAATLATSLAWTSIAAALGPSGELPPGQDLTWYAVMREPAVEMTP
jgi:Na+/proline symporter